MHWLARALLKTKTEDCKTLDQNLFNECASLYVVINTLDRNTVNECASLSLCCHTLIHWIGMYLMSAQVFLSVVIH